MRQTLVMGRLARVIVLQLMMAAMLTRIIVIGGNMLDSLFASTAWWFLRSLDLVLLVMVQMVHVFHTLRKTAFGLLQAAYSLSTQT